MGAVETMGEFFATMAKNDAMRQMQFQAVIRELQEHHILTRSRILDIGCNEGLFTRMLASPPREYQMTGIDSGAPFIKFARDQEVKRSLGINYVHIDARQFESAQPFDAAVCVMVLPYAKDPEALRGLFASAFRNLLTGRRLTSVVLHPEFKAQGKVVGNKIYTPENADTVYVQMLNTDGKGMYGTRTRQFTREQYEHAARHAGFTDVVWKDVMPADEQLLTKSPEFWQSVLQEKPYALLTAR